MFKFITARQEVPVTVSIAQAEKCFTQALELIGSVSDRKPADHSNFILKGKTAYGMQQVPLSVELVKNDRGEVSAILEAKCDDVRGIGAKESIKRYLTLYTALSTGDADAIKNITENDSFTLQTGMSKKRVVALIIFLIVIVVAAVVAANGVVK